jgi:hypothetical protein
MANLSDEQIERYSRQLILQEMGPRGQERLGTAKVNVVGTGVVAERLVGYLAAAGVGWIAADTTLHGAVDARQSDCSVVAVDTEARSAVDVAVVIGASPDAIAELVATARARATATLWVADGHAGGCPPCPRCTAAVTASAALPVELVILRDAFLGTVVATEVVKTLLAIGTPLTGRVLAYDPRSATVTNLAVESRAGCPDCLPEP